MLNQLFSTFGFCRVVTSIADTLTAGYRVWGAGAGAAAAKDFAGSTVFLVDFPGPDGVLEYREHETALDAAWDLARRADGANLTVSEVARMHDLAPAAAPSVE